MIRVLYNPLANNKNGKIEAEKLKQTYGEGISFEDVTKITDVPAYLDASGDDTIVLAASSERKFFIIPQAPATIFTMTSGTRLKGRTDLSFSILT